jgi:hypothetical protein
VIEEVFDLIREECAALEEKWGAQRPSRLSDWIAVSLNELGLLAGEVHMWSGDCRAALDRAVRIAAIAALMAGALLPLAKEEETKPCPTCGLPLGEGDHSDCLPF